MLLITFRNLIINFKPRFEEVLYEDKPVSQNHKTHI